MMKIRNHLTRFLISLGLSLTIIGCGSGGGGGGGGGNVDPRLHNTWTWMSGSDTRNQGGIYGTLNTPDPANVPGARYEAVTWIDASGNLWLFGGHGYDVNAPTGFGKLNDLWRYDGSDWTWMSGSDTFGASGVYGTAGSAAPTNVPGARSGSISWVDASGNLWLFGGYGVDESGTTGYLNDLWKFDGAEWTWVSGSKAADQNGTYGTASDEPGGRYGAVSWKDSTGNIWMFGGNGFDGSAVNAGQLNDLWKFDGSSWTWEAGSDVRNQNGTYAGLGADEPGGREGAVGWIDGSNNLWLFGGKGYGDTAGIGNLNDLWKYDGASWTWVSGSKSTYQKPTYGTLETAAASNDPGARTDAVAWKDSSGNFWLLGGYGYDSANTLGELSDLWRYDGTNWTWMHGSDLRRQAGSFGVLGQEDRANTPGAKKFAAAWTDSGGDFWLFGGDGRDSAGAAGLTNDLWEYHP